MLLAAKIIFTLSALGMLHSYLFYPLLLLIIGRRKRNDKKRSLPHEALPEISIVCAAYNEEKVIEEKIRSTFNTTYPTNKIKLVIGTDHCSDQTVSLIKKLQLQYPGVQLTEFGSRTGKINILNTLIKEIQSPLLVMTDANVFFTPETLVKLVSHFEDADTGMVCGHIHKRPLNSGAVTVSELQYMNFENRLKLAESNAWGIVMGAEGGCYAMRRELYQAVPSHFNVDDFFITCLVLKAKKHICYDQEALVYEDVAADSRGEFRRKARIATGNFQNLFYFPGLAFNFFSVTSFAFLSHKVLRWITPFLFLLNVAATLFLLSSYPVLRWLLLLQAIAIIAPLLNYLAGAAGIRLKLLQALSHFMIMNAALLTGFLRYCKGVKSSVWEPVKR